MSKKMRRHHGKSQEPRLSAKQMILPDEQTTVEARPAPAAQKPAANALPALHEQYHYVVNDLKKIALIAAVMLVVMIVLAVLLI